VKLLRSLVKQGARMHKVDDQLIQQVKAKIKGANEIHAMTGKIGLYQSDCYLANKRPDDEEYHLKNMDLDGRVLQVFVSTGEMVNRDEIRRRLERIENPV
jgi:hypothetical protein